MRANLNLNFLRASSLPRYSVAAKRVDYFSIIIRNRPQLPTCRSTFSIPVRPPLAKLPSNRAHRKARSRSLDKYTDDEYEYRVRAVLLPFQTCFGSRSRVALFCASTVWEWGYARAPMLSWSVLGRVRGFRCLFGK
jgi:hypothetical protein